MPSLVSRSSLSFFAAAQRVKASFSATLFGFFVVVYALTSAGRLDATDGIAVAQTAQSLLRGTLAIPYLGPAATVGVGNLRFARYGIAQSIVEMPFALAGLVLRHLTHRDKSLDWSIAFTNTFVTAAGCVLFYLLLRALRASRKRALVFTLIYGVCTLAWAYAKTDFSEPLQTTCLLGAVLAAVYWRERRQTRWLFLSSFFLAFTILTKSALLVIVPAFALFVIVADLAASQHPAILDALRTRTWWLRAAGRQGALWSLPAVACAITLWLNLVRFGSPFDFGYGRAAHDLPFTGSILTGVFGLLFSFNSGIIFYASPVVLGLLGLRRFVRRHLPEAVLIGALVVIFLVLYGSYYYWAGLAAFGPRYLVPLVPLLLLPAVEISFRTEDGHSLKRWAVVLVSAVAVVGFVEQLLGIFVTFEAFSVLTCLQSPCVPSLDPTHSELLFDIWLLPASIAYTLSGHLPHIILSSYPFGAAPIGRVNWPIMLADGMRYFWFMILPYPKVMLAAGVVAAGGIASACLLRLSRMTTLPPVSRQREEPVSVPVTAANAGAAAPRGHSLR